MEHKIGEIFQYNNNGDIVTLKVILDENPTQSKCDECFFFDTIRKICFKKGTIIGWCVARKDGTPVKFIKINNN